MWNCCVLFLSVRDMAGFVVHRQDAALCVFSVLLRVHLRGVYWGRHVPACGDPLREAMRWSLGGVR